MLFIFVKMYFFFNQDVSKVSCDYISKFKLF